MRGQSRARGNGFPVFPTPELGTLGMLICDDMVFPEAARCLALQGAYVIFNPTLGGAAIGDDDISLAAFRTRAAENFVYLVVAQRGKGSMIISPRGKVRATAKEPDSLAIDDVDPFGGREAGDAFNTQKANRIAIHHSLGRVVAMIEVVSPGDKDSKHAVASFVAKAVDFLDNGIHFLVIDPFPPGPRDPRGIAQAICDEVVGEPLETSTLDKPLTIAAFDAGEPLTAYLEPVGVGDPLPDAPLFLAPEWYVNVPLEQTYLASWNATPQPIRELVQ
jgi:Carbon-nitrogen hydrolase